MHADEERIMTEWKQRKQRKPPKAGIVELSEADLTEVKGGAVKKTAEREDPERDGQPVKPVLMVIADQQDF
jgi:hypothetical protein